MFMPEISQPDTNPDAYGWMDRANCKDADPEIFFPDRGSNQEEAKKFCRGCIVREVCLEWALEHREKGVWGGTSERERTRIMRRRNQAARAVLTLTPADTPDVV